MKRVRPPLPAIRHWRGVAPLLVVALLLVALLLAACGTEAPAAAPSGAEADDGGPPVGDAVTDQAVADQAVADQSRADQAEAASVSQSEGVREPPDEPPPAGSGAGAADEAADIPEREPTESEDESPPPVDQSGAEEPEAPEEDEPDLRLEFLIELRDAIDLEVVARIGRTVAERRGLALLEAVPVYLLRRADVPAFLDAEEHAEATEGESGETHFDERLFRLLGIIGREVSLDDLFRDLFVGLALGFYDFDLQGFVIISANDHIAGGDVSTITHEFVHVLQDQHFAISDYFDEYDDNTDRILAARFVVEGDARSSEALFRDLELELAGQLEVRRDRLPGLNGSVPGVLQVIFNAPYLTGVDAIRRVLNEQGYEGVDALLAALPPSTEQLLHPEKLASREPPIEVEAPDVLGALGDGWESLGADTIGEFLLATVLSPITGGGAASRAAGGWGGDRLTLYHSDEDESLLVWELRWDSEGDAEEFFRTAQDWLRGRTGARIETLEEGAAVRSEGERLAGWIGRAGGTVLFVLGEDAVAVERAAERVARGLPRAELVPLR